MRCIENIRKDVSKVFSNNLYIQARSRRSSLLDYLKIYFNLVLTNLKFLQFYFYLKRILMRCQVLKINKIKFSNENSIPAKNVRR